MDDGVRQGTPDEEGGRTSGCLVRRPSAALQLPARVGWRVLRSPLALIGPQVNIRGAAAVRQTARACWLLLSAETGGRLNCQSRAPYATPGSARTAATV